MGQHADLGELTVGLLFASHSDRKTLSASETRVKIQAVMLLLLLQLFYRAAGSDPGWEASEGSGPCCSCDL